MAKGRQRNYEITTSTNGTHVHMNIMLYNPLFRHAGLSKKVVARFGGKPFRHGDQIIDRIEVTVFLKQPKP